MWDDFEVKMSVNQKLKEWWNERPIWTLPLKFQLFEQL